MSELYNQEIKERFLEEAYEESEATKRIVWFLFKKASLYENGIDIYEMTKEDIRLLLENIKPFSRDDAKRKVSYLSNYISWAISNGLTKGNVNPLQYVTDDFYDSVLDTNMKLFFSYEEIQEIVENIANAQDQAAVMLMWHGIIGEEFKEILHLSYYDIDWNNNTIYINRTDRKTKELVRVEFTFEDRMMYFLERAHHATVQYTNGLVSERGRNLLPSKFIMKNTTQSRNVENNPVIPQTLYTRMARLKDSLELEYFTPNSIQKSGMIYMAYDLIVNQKKYQGLVTDLYQEIGAYYNYAIVKTTKDNEESYIYNTNFMSKFINEENLKKLYNLEL